MFSDYDNINYSSEIILDHKQSGKNDYNSGNILTESLCHETRKMNENTIKQRNYENFDYEQKRLISEDVKYESRLKYNTNKQNKNISNTTKANKNSSLKTNTIINLGKSQSKSPNSKSIPATTNNRKSVNFSGKTFKKITPVDDLQKEYTTTDTDLSKDNKFEKNSNKNKEIDKKRLSAMLNTELNINEEEELITEYFDGNILNSNESNLLEEDNKPISKIKNVNSGSTKGSSSSGRRDSMSKVVNNSNYTTNIVNNIKKDHSPIRNSVNFSVNQQYNTKVGKPTIINKNNFITNSSSNTSSNASSIKTESKKNTINKNLPEKVIQQSSINGKGIKGNTNTDTLIKKTKLPTNPKTVTITSTPEKITPTVTLDQTQIYLLVDELKKKTEKVEANYIENNNI